MKVLDSPYFKHNIRSLQKRYFFEEFFYVCLNFQFTLICMLKQHNFHLTYLKVWILSILWKSTNYCRIKYFTEVRRLLARHSSVQNKFMEKKSLASSESSNVHDFIDFWYKNITISFKEITYTLEQYFAEREESEQNWTESKIFWRQFWPVLPKCA